MGNPPIHNSLRYGRNAREIPNLKETPFCGGSCEGFQILVDEILSGTEIDVDEGDLKSRLITQGDKILGAIDTISIYSTDVENDNDKKLKLIKVYIDFLIENKDGLEKSKILSSSIRGILGHLGLELGSKESFMKIFENDFISFVILCNLLSSLCKKYRNKELDAFFNNFIARLNRLIEAKNTRLRPGVTMESFYNNLYFLITKDGKKVKDRKKFLELLMDLADNNSPPPTPTQQSKIRQAS